MSQACLFRYDHITPKSKTHSQRLKIIIFFEIVCGEQKMPTKYKMYVKLAVVGIIVFYSWRKYDSVSRMLSRIPVAGKLFN